MQKYIQQNPAPMKDKTLNKLGREGNFLNLMKRIYEKPTVNTTLNDERQLFPLSELNKQNLKDMGNLKAVIINLRERERENSFQAYMKFPKSLPY